LIRHEETGLLVPPGEVEAFKAAVARLMADADLRTRLGTAGQRAVRAGFDMRRWADDLSSLITARMPETAP